LDQNSYRNLISESGGGKAKALLRFILRMVSIVYAAAVIIRNFCYDIKIIKSNEAVIPVISIGNITTGGTGKTPLVIWLCNFITNKEINCSILTRGYKNPTGQISDEPAILSKSCPKAKVVVNSNRYRGSLRAVAEFRAKILIMDDGFQHRSLHRDLDIITIDATCPFGYGKMLPAGLLREPLRAIKRANAVVITHFDQSSVDETQEIEKKILQIAPGITIAKATHRHPNAVMRKGQNLSIEELKEKTIFAFCGIGNPNAFLNRLDEYELNVVGSKIFNDHHDYSSFDISEVYEQARILGADLILSTQKDWVKSTLHADNDDEILFAYLALELDFIEGDDKIVALIEKVLK
jgi:tetraacyldisaccharide 4'-kinase